MILKNFMLVLFSAVLAFPVFSQDLLITELTDPQNSTTAGRYVEIYNSSDSDIDLSTGYSLQRWTNASTTPSSPVFLTGIIAAEGFYVVCNDDAKFLTTYGVAASQDVGTNGVADSNGDDHIALLDPNGNILDIYGTPGQDGTIGSGGTSEFEDGRAERKCGTSAAAIFVPADWNMDHDSGGGDGNLNAPEGGFDPFSWTDDAGDPCVQDICPGADVEIATSSFEYLPAAIDVEAGTVVGWVNYGGNHNVNGITNSITNAAFNNPEEISLGSMIGNASGVCLGTITFTVPGVYNYDCSIGSHAANGMVASITVLGSVFGCTDANACNYDPLATADDMTCDYSCVGCMDTAACNFDLANTISDASSCDYSCVGCTDNLACNYDMLFTIGDSSCLFIGDSCDDMDAATIGDEYQPDCSCSGTVPTITNALLITAVYDGPLTGGFPKGVELYATVDIADLSTFGLGSANNGGGTDGEEFNFPADAITAGTYIFVSSDDAGAQSYFASTFANYNAGSVMSINGDDALELFEFGMIIDTFGDIALDGSGLAWDYLDSWAHRNCEQTPNGGAFVAANWTYGGINNNDGTTLNSATANPMPVGAYETTCPSVIPGCTTATACNYNINATTDDGTCELIGDSCDDADGLTENDVLLGDCSCAGTAVVTCDPIAWSIATVATNLDGDVWIDNLDGSYSANAYCGGGCVETVDLWLVSNGFDYSAVVASNLLFELAESFGATTLDLQYTTSYAGDPAAAAWSSLGTYDAAGSFNADLASLNGLSEVYLGFQYADDGADGYSGFTLSSIALTGDCPADVTVFDCPTEMVNFGDSCDDADATTFDDVIQGDCSCAGTAFDCVIALANFGDSCDDGNVMTNNDIIQNDCSCAGTPFTLSNSLVITAAFDGSLAGGHPKGVELFVVNDIADLSIFGIGSANNGGGTDGEEFTFPALSATAGDFIYVTTSELVAFNTFFGFDADYDAGFSVSINGDDAMELFEQGVVIDTFGDINVDGNGTAWEYLDGWAYRNCATGPDGSTFTIANWTFSGVDGLEGGLDNATAISPLPLGTYMTTCMATGGCTDENASNYDMTALTDDGSCVYLGCTDPLFLEYNPYALTNDGSCSVVVVLGCIYDSADNYDASANIDDNSCVFSGNSCPGDFTGDGFINVSDLGGFLGAFGTSCE